MEILFSLYQYLLLSILDSCIQPIESNIYYVNLYYFCTMIAAGLVLQSYAQNL